MSFDGTTYRGLDDTAVNDGTDSDDLPLDVFVEQAVASNSRYLLSGYNPVSVPLYGRDSDLTPVATERRWASANKSRALHYPILLTQGMTSVSFSMVYACSAEDSGGSGVDCELRVSRWNTNRVRGTTLASTDFSLTTTTGNYKATTQTVTFGPWTGPPTVAFVELWIQSDEAGDTGSTIEAEAINQDRISAKNVVSTPEQFTYRALKSDNTGTLYDPWDVFSAGLTVYPPLSEEQNTVFSIVELWYLEIRGVSIQPLYDGLLHSQCPSTEELRAQESIYSTTSIPQIVAARRTYSAPRHIAFGVAGEDSPEETSAQPWYNYKLAPVNEIIIDGVLQDAITGDDQLEIILTWGITGGFIEETLDVDITATWSILDAGDTSWGDATLVASKATGIQPYFFPGGRNCITLRTFAARANEGTTAARLNKEGLEFGDEPLQLATTVIPNIVIQSDLTPTRSKLPGRLRITFSGAGSNVYVTSYAVIARAL